MFSRAWLEVVRISKSAMKLNFEPATQESSVAPVSGSLMLVTFAILTSLAVQFSFCLFTVLYSFCKQVCAKAGTARMAITSSAKIIESFLQQLVRQLMNFLLTQPGSRDEMLVYRPLHTAKVCFGGEPGETPRKRWGVIARTFRLQPGRLNKIVIVIRPY